MRIQTGHIVSSAVADLGLTLNPPTQQCPVVITSGTLSASFSTPGINLDHMYGFSVTATITGSLSGAVSLWASNDHGNDRLPRGFKTQTAGSGSTTLNQGITNWVQIAGSLQQMSASTTAVSTMFNLSQQFYKWFQVQWSHSLGTGSIDVYYTGKGNAA